MNSVMNQRKNEQNLNARESLIKKNFIGASEQYLNDTSKDAENRKTHDYRLKTEKIVYKDHQILPQGNFQGNSQYIHEYMKKHVPRGDLIKKSGQLTIGGKFQGNSNYADNYYNKGANQRQQKVIFQDNKILPEGKFLQSSTYNANYLNNRPQLRQQIKPQGELKIGGQFYGQSSYANNYYDKGFNEKRQLAHHQDNKILPEGKFENGTTYTHNYVPNAITMNKQIRPEGQLKVGGGNFDGSSSYNADFEKKSQQARRQKIVFKDNKIMPDGQFNGQTVYQYNYSQATPSPTKQIKHEGQLKVGGKFEGTSNYSNNYYDKGYNAKPEKFVPPQNKFMPEGQFQNQTTYTGNYQENPLQKIHQFKPQGQLKVGGGNFEGHSVYESEYHKKQGGLRAQRSPLPNNMVIPKGNFNGQSTYGDTYINSISEKVSQIRPEGQLKVGGKFQGESNYAQNYFDKGFNGKAEKFVPPSNKFMPEGQFQDGTTYTGNYIQTDNVQRSPQFRPQGQLKVGEGQFNGQSQYTSQFTKRQGNSRVQRVPQPKNDVMPKGKFLGNSEYEQSYIPTTLSKNPQFIPEHNLSIGGKFEGNTTYAHHYDIIY